MRYSPYLFIAPFFVLFAVFGVFPLVYTGWVSLHDWDLIGDHTFVGLANYTELLADPDFWNAVVNTFGIFLIATVPQLLLALMLANLLNRALRARTLFRMGVLVPNVTSVAAVGDRVRAAVRPRLRAGQLAARPVGVDPVDWQAGRSSSWIAIAAMVDWRWTGYNALIYLAAMQAIPRDLYEAAGDRRREAVAAVLADHRAAAAADDRLRGDHLDDRRPAAVHRAAALRLRQRSRAARCGQSQTMTMYMYENAFQRFEFGYGSAVAWCCSLIVVVISVLNFLVDPAPRRGVTR